MVTLSLDVLGEKRVLIRRATSRYERGGFFMTNYKVAYWLATAAIFTCVATAQNSQLYLSTSRPAPDPLKNATKPLTEKSAATVHHPSPVVMPQKPASGGNTNAELSRLERQKVTAKSPKTGSASSVPRTSSSKTGDSTESSAAINYKYQKPAGGMQAETRNARTPNSSTPRVTKQN
jgi:hypothetical protein